MSAFAMQPMREPDKQDERNNPNTTGRKPMTAEETRTLKHELRTPINHIIGYSELLLEAAEDEGMSGVADQARSIYTDGRALAKLVDRHFAMWDGGERRHATLDLRESISSLINSVRRKSVPPVEVDAAWLRDFDRIRGAAERLAILMDEGA
jgi:signal transduction histidine kinase